MSLIMLDSDDDVSEDKARESTEALEEELTISVATWGARIDERYPKLDSAAAAGIARLRARDCDVLGDPLGSVAFRLHAQRHEVRAEIYDQHPKRLADLPAEKASAA